MSILGRTVSRLVPVVLEAMPKVVYSRTATILPAGRNFSCLSSASTFKLSESRLPCYCGCGGNGRHLHTKGDKEMADFLLQEIDGEKKNLVANIPSKIDDFSVRGNGSELILKKKFNDEEITVTLDVNHSVDDEGTGELSQGGDQVDFKSRPSFEVDIKKGNKVVSFTCSYSSSEETTEQQGQDTVNEVFGINEITIYEGEWSEETYCVSGDILDPNLYDLMLNYLEERGISDAFVEKLSSYCSDYEHSLYVGLLQKLHDFVK